MTSTVDPNELRDRLAPHHEACYAWARYCCDYDRGEAEDVLQTVYLKILDGRARFDGRSALRTWLFGVIRRTAAEARRRHLLRRFWQYPLDGREHASDSADADDVILGHEVRAVLQRALDSLPRRQREVLILVFYHEHTVDDAARILGIGKGSARTHYARGKQRLRVLLTPILQVDDAPV